MEEELVLELVYRLSRLPVSVYTEDWAAEQFRQRGEGRSGI